MDMPTSDFVRAGSLEELKAKGRLVVRGRHRPILLVHENGRVFALDNRCPHMGFPLDRGSIEDGILTCHWHHARFDARERLHLRSVGGRRADLPGRNPCAAKSGSSRCSAMPIRPSIGAGGSRTGSRMI